MNTVFLSAEKLDDDLLTNSFFKLYKSHLLITSKNEIETFRLDKISNVRFSKKRNFSINISLLISSALIYYFGIVYLDTNFLFNIVSMVIILILIILSFLIKKYNYLLLINLNNFCYKELKLSKKESSFAEYFVSIYKLNVSKK